MSEQIAFRECPECHAKTVMLFRYKDEGYAFCSVCDAVAFKIFMLNVGLGVVTYEVQEV